MQAMGSETTTWILLQLGEIDRIPASQSITSLLMAFYFCLAIESPRIVELGL
jgi:hypothetical protein